MKVGGFFIGVEAVLLNAAALGFERCRLIRTVTLNSFERVVSNDRTCQC